LTEALTIASDVLKELGESIPTSPGMVTVMCEYLKTVWMMRGMTDQDILSLPLATDSTIVATMTMLNFAWWYGYGVKPAYAA
jgi:hypothetical protein